MKPGVKIRKRDDPGALQGSLPGRPENTPRQSEREIANAVKNWIAELAQRKRTDEHNILLRLGAQRCVLQQKIATGSLHIN
jgi:hypothetical protein